MSAVKKAWTDDHRACGLGVVQFVTRDLGMMTFSHCYRVDKSHSFHDCRGMVVVVLGQSQDNVHNVILLFWKDLLS